MLISKLFPTLKAPIHSYVLVLFFFGYSMCSSAQNYQKIDSLLQVLTTDITDRHKVDVYVDIARNHESLDFEKIKMYGNKAITLAKENNYIEGTIDALNQIGNAELRRSKNSEAEQLFLKILELADKNDYTKGKVEAYRGLGRANRKLEKVEQALEYFFESLSINKYLGDKLKEAINHNDIGLVYRLQGNSNKALEYFFLSIELAKQIDYNQGVAISYMNIGNLYRENGNYDDAIDYLSRSIEIHIVNNQYVRESNGYENLGSIFYRKKMYNKALEYYFKALNIKREYVSEKYNIAEIHSRIAEVYLAMRDFKVALEYCFEALKIYEDISIHAEMPSTLYKIGEIYDHQNQIKLAREYTTQGIIIAQQYGLLKDIRYGSRQLGLIEGKHGNLKKAIEANILSMQMTDSLYDIEEIKMIAALEAQYKFRKEKDSLQLVRQHEIVIRDQNIKNQKERALITYASIGLFLIIGIWGFVYQNKRVQREKYHLLRNSISRDLHDEIGSTLSSIAMYGTIAEKELTSKPEKARGLIQKMNSYAITSIESMNDIVWSIKSSDASLELLIQRIRSYLSEIENIGNWQTSITFDDALLKRSLGPNDMRNLYLILKESINNALKYSEGNRIDVSFFTETKGKSIIVEVEDNGCGFDIETLNLTDSNGIVNMQKRAEDLKGLLEFEVLKSEGFKMKLTF